MQQFGFLVLLPEMKLKTSMAFHSKCVVGIIGGLSFKGNLEIFLLIAFKKFSARTGGILEHFQIDPQNTCMF